MRFEGIKILPAAGLAKVWATDPADRKCTEVALRLSSPGTSYFWAEVVAPISQFCYEAPELAGAIPPAKCSCRILADSYAGKSAPCAAKLKLLYEIPRRPTASTEVPIAFEDETRK